MQAIDIFRGDDCPRGYRHTAAAQVSLQQYTYSIYSVLRTRHMAHILTSVQVHVRHSQYEGYIAQRVHAPAAAGVDGVSTITRQIHAPNTRAKPLACRCS